MPPALGDPAWAGVGLGDPQRALPTPAMLGFCDSVILCLYLMGGFSCQTGAVCPAAGLESGAAPRGCALGCDAAVRPALPGLQRLSPLRYCLNIRRLGQASLAWGTRRTHSKS